jgi:hypothetical protein
MDKTAYYGYLLIERAGENRIKHFRNSSARRLSTAEARIHDLVRNKQWVGTRVFEIWDGIIPLSLTVCTRTENGNVEIKKKSYLLPEFNGSIVTRKGKVKICDKLGHEKDYREANRHQRIIRTGPRAGDMTSFIKSGAKERILCTKADPKDWKNQFKYVKREL